MNNGHCPNCNSDEIYTTQAFSNLRARGYSVNVSVDMDGKELSISAYVCAKCGRVEMFVDDVDKLPQLATAKGWHKVGV